MLPNPLKAFPAPLALSSAASRVQLFAPNLYQGCLRQTMPFTWHQLVQTAHWFFPFKPILGAVLFFVQQSLKELLILCRLLLPSYDPMALQGKGWKTSSHPTESFGTHMDRETALSCKVQPCHCDWSNKMGTPTTCTPQVHMGTRTSWNGSRN